jgi:hypothetical protein
MLVFSRKVFDGLVSGTSDVFTDMRFSSLLGSVEQVAFEALVLGIGGTSPTLTIQLQHSMDGIRWMNQNATPEVNASALTPTDDLFPFLSSSNTILRYVRLRIALGGTSPSAVVVLRAVGRSPAGI